MEQPQGRGCEQEGGAASTPRVGGWRELRALPDSLQKGPVAQLPGSWGGLELCGHHAEGFPPPWGPVFTRGCLPADYMAHLVEVQHERGASGGQTFHSLLTASLPARRGTHPSRLARPLGKRLLLPGVRASVYGPTGEAGGPGERALCRAWEPAPLWAVGPRASLAVVGMVPATAGRDGLSAALLLLPCRQHRGAETQKQPRAATGPGQAPGRDTGAGSGPRGRPGQHAPAGMAPLLPGPSSRLESMARGSLGTCVLAPSSQ